MPEDEIVPYVEFPPTIPFTSQLTAVLLVPETVALNARDCPTCTLVAVGETETDIEVGALMTTVAVAYTEVRHALCAVTFIEPDGTDVGAV
jgi:hypothetical protein